MPDIQDILAQTAQPDAPSPTTPPPEGRMAVLDPTGKPGTVPADLYQSFLDQGYQPDTPDARAQAAAYAKYGEGIGNTAAAVGLGALSGATLGLTEGVVAPEATAAHKQFQPIAFGAGQVAGAVGFAALAPELSPVGMIGRLGSGAAEALGGSAVARVAGSAVEGAAFGLGKSVNEAMLGDPDLTAQRVVANIGLGALIGGAVGGVFQGIAGLGRTQMGEKAVQALQEKAQAFAEAPGETIGNALGSLKGGWVGHKVGSIIGGAIDDAGMAKAAQKLYSVMSDHTSDAAQALLEHAGAAIGGAKASAVGDLLDVIHTAGNPDPDQEQRAVSLGQLERHANATEDQVTKRTDKIFTKGKSDPGRTWDQPVQETMDDVRALDSDPMVLIDRVHANTAALTPMAPKVTDAINATAGRAVQYLASKLPPQAPQAPLDTPPPAVPKSQVAAFKTALGVVNNPLSVLHHAAVGTLSQAHMEALNAVYPQLHDQVVAAVANRLAEHGNARLSYGQKSSLSMLMGAPMSQHLAPQGILAAQAAMQAPQPQQQGAVKPSQKGLGNLDVSGRLLTDQQRSASRNQS